jgi:hypothetical protein
MTDTMISQNIDLSSWNTLYIIRSRNFSPNHNDDIDNFNYTLCT